MKPSILDNDFYTFTVGAAVFQIAPTVTGRYEFKCRNEGVVFDEGFRERFTEALKKLDGLKLALDELSYVADLEVFPLAYIHFLENLTFHTSDIRWKIERGELYLSFDGPIINYIFYEVAGLAAINESYFQGKKIDLDFARLILDDKIKLIRQNRNGNIAPNFVEFGTRRRLSDEWQREVIHTLKEGIGDQLLGTSNVRIARELGLKALGTQSHQWYQLFQALGPLQDSIKNALDSWLLAHRGRFAVALTDIVGSEAFFKRLDPLHWNALDGFRGDSGDNVWWIKLALESMRKVKISPKSKTLYLSNGLDVPECFDLYYDWSHYFKDLIFCIGTKFSNHTNEKALNIVIKLTQVNGQPVAKISDDKGKGMCNSPGFLRHLCETFQIQTS